MKNYLQAFKIFCILSLAGFFSPGHAQFINEIHYDNAGTDTGEAIEIAGPAGTDLNGWSLVLYNGSTGSVYNTNSLSGTIPDQDNGFGTLSYNYPTNGIQNGSPDGIALVNDVNEVVQFLSYEGIFSASGGNADGLNSNDIGVSESSGTPVGSSLQLTGIGSSYEDFNWAPPADDSFGQVNNEQSFGGAPRLLINEFVFNHTGTDNYEYLEVLSRPNFGLSTYSILEIEGDGSGAGTVDGVFLLGVTDANGFFVTDFLSNELENGTVTLLLVENFSGNEGVDLDTDNDGILESLPWERIVDAVAVSDGGSSDFTYTDVVLNQGYDGSSFTVGGASRIPNGTDTDSPSDFVRNDFAGAGIAALDPGTPEVGEAFNTPGTENRPVTDLPTNVLINEVDADQVSTDAAEFVELYDGGLGNTSLDGLVLVLYNGNGDIVYDAIDLDGNATDANGFFVVGSTNVANVNLTAFTTNGLQNGADAVALYGGNSDDFPDGQAITTTNIIDAVVYDTDDADDPGLLVLLNAGQPQLNEDANNQATTQSLQRVPDGAGSQRTTDQFIAASPTPGEANQEVITPALKVAVYEIQGISHTSPLLGEVVTTEGIVTAVDNNGFYLQDATGDGDITTSDALFVFTRSSPAVTAGDEVRVSATVSEFTPGGASSGNLSITQLSGNPTIEVISSGNMLPDAVILGTDGRVPPSMIIDNDQDTPYNVLSGEGNFNPTQDGLDFYESLEGMRVIVQSPTAVSPTSRFGEIFTIAAGSLPSGLSTRGTLNISPDDFNPERIQIDSDSFTPGNIPSVDVGAKLADVTGVVSYSFGNFEVLATEVVTVFTSSELVPEVSDINSNDDRLTVSSYNVLNLDPNDNDGDTDIADGKFVAIAIDIVKNLNTPDIIGLQEVQDNDGSDNSNVFAADRTLQLLVDEIANISGLTYDYIDNPFIADDQSGGQPGGNIRTAFLYRPDRVSLASAPQNDDFTTGAVQTVVDPQDQQDNPDNPFFNSRLPLVGIFSFNGQEVVVINNHFSSKGGSLPLLGAIQPSVALQNDPGSEVNGNLNDRIAQAEAVNNFVKNTLQTRANVITLGDFNEFEFIKPLEILGQHLINLTENLPEDERYSFIFSGNSQSLDHLLVSEALSDEATFDVVHLNTEFVGDSRTSDHDPLLAGLFLPLPVCVEEPELPRRGRRGRIIHPRIIDYVEPVAHKEGISHNVKLLSFSDLKELVVISKNPITTVPEDGKEYRGSLVYGSGDVLSDGVFALTQDNDFFSRFLVKGLEADTRYYLKVFIYSQGENCSPNYVPEAVAHRSFTTRDISFYQGIKDLLSKLKSNVLNVYPNPIRDAFSINVPSRSHQRVEILISDLRGKSVSLGSFELEKGDNPLELNIGELGFEPNVYLLRVVSRRQFYPIIRLSIQ